jgi:hypothetical protein
MKISDTCLFSAAAPGCTFSFFNLYFSAGYLEDCPHIGTFTYRLKGFDSPPTDHYARTYYIASAQEYSHHKKYCMGSIPRHKVS